MDTIKIEKLTRNLMRENIERICKIERVAVETSDGRYRDPWNRDNFLYELPGKWTYSRVIRNNDEIEGFFIGSQKTTQKGEQYVHGHKVAFLPSIRQRNLYPEVLNDVFREARKNGLRWFTGYIMGYHYDFLMWYVRVLECEILQDRRDIECFVGKLLDGAVIENDGKLIFPGGLKKYVFVKKL